MFNNLLLLYIDHGYWIEFINQDMIVPLYSKDIYNCLYLFPYIIF